MIIQEGARYRVKLNAVAEIGRFKYRPLNELSVTASILSQIVDKYGEAVLDLAEQE